MKVLPFGATTDVESALPQVIQHLELGGLLAYPTETVYGLGSRVLDADLKALCALTERPPGKPFLMLIAGMQMAVEAGLVFSDAAVVLADRFWPGPLTLVLRGAESALPQLTRGARGGVAVRWSSHVHTSRLIEGLEIPLSSTSANRSGRSPLPDVDSIRAEFRGPVESGDLMLLDGGRLDGSLPSTLVDCTSKVPEILREGAIERRAVLECFQEVLN